MPHRMSAQGNAPRSFCRLLQTNKRLQRDGRATRAITPANWTHTAYTASADVPSNATHQQAIDRRQQQHAERRAGLASARTPDRHLNCTGSIRAAAGPQARTRLRATARVPLQPHLATARSQGSTVRTAATSSRDPRRCDPEPTPTPVGAANSILAQRRVALSRPQRVLASRPPALLQQDRARQGRERVRTVRSRSASQGRAADPSRKNAARPSEAGRDQPGRDQDTTGEQAVARKQGRQPRASHPAAEPDASSCARCRVNAAPRPKRDQWAQVQHRQRQDPQPETCRATGSGSSRPSAPTASRSRPLAPAPCQPACRSRRRALIVAGKRYGTGFAVRVAPANDPARHRRRRDPPRSPGSHGRDAWRSARRARPAAGSRPRPGRHSDTWKTLIEAARRRRRPRVVQRQAQLALHHADPIGGEVHARARH
jgi:hypothetical protein